MNGNLILQSALYLVVLLAAAWPLGLFMARVYSGERTFLYPVLAPVERALYRIAGVREADEMRWTHYAVVTLAFNAVGFLVVYALQRLQVYLPLNPEGMVAVSPDSSFNTAASFITNTNWQGYGGESTMSYLTQMLALTVQNFFSAATGMAILVALIRGFARKSMDTIGMALLNRADQRRCRRLDRGGVHGIVPGNHLQDERCILDSVGERTNLVE